MSQPASAGRFFVDVEGARLHVEAFGSGIPVLMPTGGGIPFYRNTFSPSFLERVLIFAAEMRGTGASTGSMAGQTFASMADDLDHVRQALGFDDVIVLGHSNHGCIALEYALRHPARTAAAVTIGSAPDFRHAFTLGRQRWDERASPAAKARLQQLQAEFETFDLPGESADAAMLRRYISLTPLGWLDSGFDQAPLWQGGSRGLAAYLSWLFESGHHWNLVPRLPEIAAPLLAVCGRFDYLCPVELWEQSIAALPRGELVVLEGSAHNPQFEQPAEFDAVLLDFIARTAGSRR